MKLIKITEEHYVIVDDSEVRPNDFVYSYVTNKIVKFTDPRHFSDNSYKKITHSTQPIEKDEETYTYEKVKYIPLSYIKELIDEVDVEKKSESSSELQEGTYTPQHKITYKHGYQDGYNQALEDNKDKKYTEDDMIKASKYGYEFRDTTSFPEHKFEDSCINNTKQWLQWLSEPKTEWEVEIVDGKLKLK